MVLVKTKDDAGSGSKTAGKNAVVGGGFGSGRRFGSRSLSNRRRAVPILYGRRFTEGLLIEKTSNYYSELPAYVWASMYAISEGEIEEIVAYYDDGNIRRVEGDDRIDTTAPDSFKMTGIFYRVGGAGVEDTETKAEYNGNGGDAATWLRDQNRDFYSETADTLAHTAYASVIQIREEDTPVERFQFEVRGVKCQRYTNAATPTKDDGGLPVWTRNPIWQVVDLLLSDRYGLGRKIEAADLDFTVIKPQADYCEVEILGQVGAVTQVLPSDGTIYRISGEGSALDLEVGMTVEYFGTNHDPAEDDTIVEIISPTQVRLTTDRFATYDPVVDTITAKTLRYSSDIVIDEFQTADEAIGAILSSCRGYITYDADGKIRIYAEQTGSSTATYAESGAAQGYAAKDFRVSHSDGRRDPDINRVHALYRRQGGKDAEYTSTDFDHIESNHLVASVEIGLPGVDNREVAVRLADIERKKHRLGAGGRVTLGPIALQHEPGDIITLTGTVPNLSAEEVRITRLEYHGPNSAEGFGVTVDYEAYDSSIYDITAAATPESHPNTNEPTMALSVISQVAGTVNMKWTFVGNKSLVKWWRRHHRVSASMGTPPIAGFGYGALLTSDASKWSYTVADASELDLTHYFSVTAIMQDGTTYHSNEITAIPTLKDPTDDQGIPGVNLVYDGGFNNPDVWEFTAPSTSTVNPTRDQAWTGSGISRTDYTTEENCYDDDVDTAGTTSGSSHFGGQEFGLDVGDSSVVTGYFQFTHELSKAGRQGFQVSADNLSTRQDVDTESVSEKLTSETQVISGPKNQIWFMAFTNPRHASFLGSLYEIDWIEISAGAFSSVSGSEGTIRGGGTGVSYGDLRREYPGQYGIDGYTLKADQQFTVQLNARLVESGGTSTDDILVQLYEVDSDTYYTLMKIKASEITATYQSWAAMYTVPADVVGTFKVVVRSENASAYNVDHLQINEGGQLFAMSVNKDERAKEVDYRFGRRGGYTRGAWVASGDSTETKKTTVS